MNSSISQKKILWMIKLSYEINKKKKSFEERHIKLALELNHTFKTI